MSIFRVFVLVAMASLLQIAGCSTPGGSKTPTYSSEGAAGDVQGGDDAGQGTPLAGASELSLTALDDPDSPLSNRVIYFDYDSAEVRVEDQQIVAAHGRLLAANPSQKVRLEGHTDERGSREYNLGLGERRAHTVAQLLKLEGVANDQIELISYGEEVPLAQGHDESAWQQNRRVEIIYEGR